MPQANMRGIIVHWTAGNHTANATDRQHYPHPDRRRRQAGARKSIDRAQQPAESAIRQCGAYAEQQHRLDRRLAVLHGRGDGKPVQCRRAPMTRTQWDALPPVLGSLCRRYGITVSPRTGLSHAEVQGTLGITQRGKWDISRLPFDLRCARRHCCRAICFRQATSARLATS